MTRKGPGATLFTEKDDNKSITPSLDDGNNKEQSSDESSPSPNIDQDNEEYVQGWRLISLMVSISSVTFLMLLDISIIATAIPRITSQFHSLHDIGWYGSAYNLASAALQPLSGKLYTYFRSKWLFLGFLLVLEAGSVICAAATSSTMFIIGRAVAGLGSSGIMNGALTILIASSPLEKRPLLMGSMLGFTQLGLVLGPLVGGALTEYTTWRWCFWINLPVGGLGALLILLVNIPDRRTHLDMPALKIITTKLDLTGFMIFAPCTVMFLMALQWGGVEYAWKSATVIGLFCGSGALLLIFIYWEHRVGDGAMIPLSVIRKRQIWAACVTIFMLFAMVFVGSYYMPIYFQSIRGASPFTSGVNLLPNIIPQLVAAVLSGVLIQKVGYYLPFSICGAMVAAVGNGLLTTLNPHTSTIKWAGYQVILGFGRGLAMQVPFLAVQANSPPALTSVASATLVFSQTFGGAVFSTVSNVIFNNKLKEELAKRVPHLKISLIIDAGASAVAQVTPEGDLPQVLAAYAKGVNATFYLAVAASVAMFFSSMAVGFNSVKKSPDAKKSEV